MTSSMSTVLCASRGWTMCVCTAV